MAASTAPLSTLFSYLYNYTVYGSDTESNIQEKKVFLCVKVAAYWTISQALGNILTLQFIWAYFPGYCSLQEVTDYFETF